MRQTKNLSTAEARLRAFSNKRRKYCMPAISQLPLALNKADHIGSMPGYSILPCKPVLQYKEIQNLKQHYALLKANKYLPKPVNEGPAFKLLEMETRLIRAESDLTENANVLFTWDLGEYAHQFNIGKTKSDGLWMIRQTDIDADFPGCLFFKELLKSQHVEAYQIGMVLMEKYLEVYTWFQITDESYPIEYLEAITMQQEEYEGDEKENPTVDDWKLSTREIWLQNGDALTCPDIAAAYEDQNIQEKAFIELKKSIFNLELIDRINVVLQTEILPIVNWMKGILYLIIHDFKLGDYSGVIDDEYDSVPIHKQYAIYNEYDAWFRFIDSFDADSQPMDPVKLELVSEHHYIKLNPKKNHDWLFQIFNDVFSIDFTKASFINEKQKHYISPRLSTLDIQQWEFVLRRRINNS